MAKQYDVIVVGAGPAGFLAAKTCAENGLNVALLEKKTDITHLTRTCAQTLLSMQEYYLGDLVWYNQRDKRICFPAHGFSLGYDGPYKNLYAWYFFAPDGHPVRLGVPDDGRNIGDDARLAIVYDKDELYKSLLKQVKEVGVEVFTGVEVEKTAATADGVKVEGSGRSFEGTYCIAADGVNSRIAENLGMNKDRYYWCNLYAVSYYMEGVDVPDPNIVITSTGYFEKGTALFFVAPRPYEGQYNVQFLSIDPGVDLQAAAEYFFNDAFTAPWFKQAKKLRSLSAVCNCYDPILEPFKDNVLIAGDVGSTQELENSGAMICGWQAGKAISTACQEKKLGLPVSAIDGYAKWWREAYCEGYSHEDYMKNWVLPFVLTEPGDMSYAFGLIKETLPAIFNPYTGGKLMGKTMGGKAAIIEKERPDILKKLGKLRTPLKEVYAEVTRNSKPV